MREWAEFRTNARELAPRFDPKNGGKKRISLFSQLGRDRQLRRN